MKVSLDKQDQLLELIPCLCQFTPNSKFGKGVIGITKTEFLLYSDMEPTKIINDVFYYTPYATLEIKDIITLVKSEIKKNNDLKKYIRVDILCRDAEDSKIFYFPKASNSKLARLIKAAKKAKLPVVDSTVYYALGSC